MKYPTSIAEKKDFLKWFLKNFRFHKRECVWLLNYFVSDDHVMENLHFVEYAEYCPKAIILSTTCSNKLPFRFVKDGLITSDIEKAFHDIRLAPDEKVFIQLNFNGANKNPYYAFIVEENPYLPESLHPKKQFSIWAKFILDEALVKFKYEHLTNEINKALDSGDKEKFLQLTEKLNNLLGP